MVKYKMDQNKEIKRTNGGIRNVLNLQPKTLKERKENKK
jgi:hypothetical protein